MNSVEWYISQFPESMFLCAANNQREYAQHVITGRDKAARSHVLICTIMRNIDKVLPYTLARIEATRSLFEKSHVFIYENDSKDQTKNILKRIQDPDCTICSEDVHPEPYVDMKGVVRRRVMANARNKYLEFARKYTTNNLVDYIIILDADLLGGWSYHGLLNSIGQSIAWDVIGSNSIYYVEHETKWRRLFYDSWAFRPLNHPEELSDSEANLFMFNKGEKPIPVNSCFGGLAIYKPHFIWEGVNYTEEDCDHPTLHNVLRTMGYDICLNPSQITVYNKSQYVI
jgi:hypothetical protein